MSDLREKVEQRLAEQREHYIAYLKSVIACDSSVIEMGRRGNELAVQRLIEEKLRSMGAEIDRFEPDNDLMRGHVEFNPGHSYSGRPNVVGRMKGTGGGRSLLVNAHADVVPANEEGAWICPPYQPQVIDGRVYGRGACDMKAGGAAAMMALETLHECGIRLRGDVLFESVVDEEGGGNGTLACCLKGYRADAAVIPEPTDLKVMPAHMGWLFYRVTFSGQATHCAFKWTGVNAIEKCVDFIQRMREVERNWAALKRHPYLPPPTMCFTVVQGGNSSSTVPEKCVLDMSLHFHPCETVNGEIGARIDAEFRREVELFVRSDEWLSQHPPEIECFQRGSAYDIGDTHPITAAVRSCVEQATGKPAEVQGLACGADARLLTNFADTPTILCGPGSGLLAHAINEYVPVEEYLNAIRMFCYLFMDWCGTQDE